MMRMIDGSESYSTSVHLMSEIGFSYCFFLCVLPHTAVPFADAREGGSIIPQWKIHLRAIHSPIRNGTV